MPHETAAVSTQILCTPYNPAPCHHAPCHFMQSHIRKVHACLTVTYHLHFWQNVRDLLRATAEEGVWLPVWLGNTNLSRPTTLWNAFVSAQLYIQGDPQSVQLGHFTATVIACTQTRLSISLVFSQRSETGMTASVLKQDQQNYHANIRPSTGHSSTSSPAPSLPPKRKKVD